MDFDSVTYLTSGTLTFLGDHVLDMECGGGSVVINDDTNNHSITLDGSRVLRGQFDSQGANDARVILSYDEAVSVVSSTNMTVSAPAGLLSVCLFPTTAVSTAISNGMVTIQQDTTKPTFSAAVYYMGNSTLTITYNEFISKTAHDSAKVHIRNTGQSSGGVTLSNSMITNNGTNSITYRLPDANAAMVNIMAAPQLDIDAGAVSDISGNRIAAVSDQSITVHDTLLPTLIRATYYTNNGTISILFSETIQSVDGSKISITNGTSTVYLSGIVTVSASVVTATLNSTDQSKFANATTLSLTMGQNGVMDTAGNGIASITQNMTIYPTPQPQPDPEPKPEPTPTTTAPPVISTPQLIFSPSVIERPLLVMNPDYTSPGIVGALYDAEASVVYVTFDETIDADTIDVSGFTLMSDNSVLGLGNISDTHDDVRRLAIPVTSNETLDILSLTVDADSISDLSGNPILYHPSFSVTNPGTLAAKSASYYESTETLVVSFNGVVTDGDKNQFYVNGSSLGDGMNLLDIVPTKSLYFALDAELVDTLLMMPVLDVGPGAALSLDGVPSKQTLSIPVSTPGRISVDSIDAVYDNTTGTLYLDMDNAMIINHTNVMLRDSSVTLSLSEMNVVFNGEAVSSGDSVLSGKTAIHLDIKEDALLVDGGMAPATFNIPVRIFNGINTDVTSSILVDNGTSVLFTESGLVLGSTPEGIFVIYVSDSDTLETLSFVPVNDTAILDMKAMRGTTHVAVLTGDSMRFLDVADPVSPQWTGKTNMAKTSSYGILTPVTLDGLAHVVSITPDTLTLVHASNVYEPKIISSAKIRNMPDAGFDMTSFGSNTVYTSLDDDSICYVDMTNTANYDYHCRNHNGMVGSMDTLLIRDAQFVVSAGDDASGVSIRGPDLKQTHHIATPKIPTDIRTVTIYNSTYTLTVSDKLHVHDVTAEPYLVGSTGLYKTLDVAEFGGSTYAVLLDGTGTVSLVDLTNLEMLSE